MDKKEIITPEDDAATLYNRTRTGRHKTFDYAVRKVSAIEDVKKHTPFFNYLKRRYS